MLLYNWLRKSVITKQAKVKPKESLRRIFVRLFLFGGFLMKIDILGAEHKILFHKKDHCKMQNQDGYFDESVKEIGIIDIDSMEKDENSIKSFSNYQKLILRHELIHAFFKECGLSNYCSDELLVEVLAVNFHKLKKIVNNAEELLDKNNNYVEKFVDEFLKD